MALSQKEKEAAKIGLPVFTVSFSVFFSLTNVTEHFKIHCLMDGKTGLFEYLLRVLKILLRVESLFNCLYNLMQRLKICFLNSTTNQRLVQ